MSMSTANAGGDDPFNRQAENFVHWELIKDCIDQFIDMMLNYRQSGHPGGSRSKVHALVATTLGGAMRWDLRRPELAFADRFVLVAGHCAPLVYATLPVYHEALREMHKRTGDRRYEVPRAPERALVWEDLMGFRRNGGLAGHAEFEGKTLFFKFNTGPSGHGGPPAAGEALALLRAGVKDVKVFALEGEGGHSAGAIHETKNSAWGLGLENLCYVLDWNDFGIDSFRASSVVPGTPEEWFRSYGWRVHGAENGSDWDQVTRAILAAALEPDKGGRPGVAYVRTRKGRGYGKYDWASHGVPHKLNSPEFWEVRKRFMEKYGISYEGAGQPAPTDPAAVRQQAVNNFRMVAGVLHVQEAVLEYLSDRLIELAAAVPDRPAAFNLSGKAAQIFADERIYDFRRYPESMWAKPGEKKPNRAALASWGAWVNSYARQEYDRPLFVVCSADLAGSTNIAGFAADFDGVQGWGWYHRADNPRGCLLPQEITEFTNAGIMAGLATVNLAEDPFEQFNGFWGACSTYGSFSYLKYGPMRLFSQLAQDCQLRVGKVIWIAGHSGPETAEDSRTHFGVFAPGVTQLFPEGHVIDLHPWEYNEVPVVLGTALRENVPIVALHLTRPPIEIPDRTALGMPSHFEAARGAYVVRQFRDGKPRAGTVFVQGTTTTANLVQLLPELDRAGLNVKVVAAISPQLFDRQDEAYREAVITTADRWDSMVISNRALRVTRDWVTHPLVAEYSMCSDWDNRWRTGGSVAEVMEEAHLSADHILQGIERFVRERDDRMRRLSQAVQAAQDR